MFIASIDVELSERTVLQPDLVVAPCSQVADDGIHAAPLLAIEILSPSTRRRDLVTKREILERAGCAHYRVIDPDDGSMRVWSGERRIRDGDPRRGDAEVRVMQPVELTLRCRTSCRRRAEER